MVVVCAIKQGAHALHVSSCISRSRASLSQPQVLGRWGSGDIGEKAGMRKRADLLILCCIGKGCSVHVRGLCHLCVTKHSVLQPPQDQALAHGGLPEKVAFEGSLCSYMPKLGGAQHPAQKPCVALHHMASHGCPLISSTATSLHAPCMLQKLEGLLLDESAPRPAQTAFKAAARCAQGVGAVSIHARAAVALHVWCFRHKKADRGLSVPHRRSVNVC